MISVIVPYKDAGQWIGRCCESLHKNRGDFEFIMIDDWNRDGSAEIVSRYVEIDDRFQWFMSHGHGVSAARNTGIDAARGEWITFLDADDEMLPGAYRSMIRFATGNINQFNHLRYYPAKGRAVRRYSNDGGIYELPILPDVWFGVWNKLFRAEFLDGIRFNESMQYGEDGLFVLECLAKDGRIHHADRMITTVLHRFENPCSLSKSKTVRDMVDQCRIYEDFFLQHDDQDLRLAMCSEMKRIWSKIRKRVTK